MNEFELNSAQRGLDAMGCGRSDKQLNTFDYMADIPGNVQTTDFVEVQFKNTRKDYFLNSNHLSLKKGDVVAVEASPGHDIGEVTLTGSLVLMQMKKVRIKGDPTTRRVYRLAKDIDMMKYEEAKAREHETMIRSRQIAKELGLDMKIGDVEYQGDGGKAIFYYIADGRVDFRKLIKVLTEEFHVRVEMKQIGARQEAGRIGGIGPCGRELCCATWIKNFVTVSTGAARQQDVSLNPQKLAGQCAKLKCCLNYEVSTYAEAARMLPPRDVHLETQDATYYYFKTDIIAGLVTYSTDRHFAANAVTITAARAKAVAAMNRNGEKPLDLRDDADMPTEETNVDLAAQDSLTRFDKSKRKKRKNNRNRPSANANTAVSAVPASDQPAERTDDKAGERTYDRPRNRNNRNRRRGPRPAGAPKGETTE